MGRKRYRGFEITDPHEVHESSECLKWCKVHWIWNYDAGRQVPYPVAFNILTSSYGWVNVDVFVGPPAYFPKREASY